MLLKFRFIKLFVFKAFLKIVPSLGVVHLLHVRTPMYVVAVFLLHLLSFLCLPLLVLFSLIVCCHALCDRPSIKDSDKHLKMAK
jgi:hypothetical protein